MPTTTVKQTGKSTLTGVANYLGVSLQSLKAANPHLERGKNYDLIYPEDIITIPSATPSPMEKVAEIKSQLGAEPILESQEIKMDQLGPTKSALTGATYDIGKIQTDLASAGTQKKSAYDELIGIQSKLYEDEYTKAGLGATKAKISTIDQDIAKRKDTRDKLVLDETGKPIPQWMITGRKKQEVDVATADLNRMTDERNALATDYNLGIDEVTKKAEFGTKDAATKYSYWESEETRLTNLMKTYQDMMSTELGGGGISTQVVEANGRKLLVNSTTGEIIKDLGEAPVTGTETSLQAIKDPDTGEVVGYFNPATGKTTKYGAAAPAPVSYTEKEFRNKVATLIKGGTSLDAMKKDSPTVQIVGSDKTAEEIINEEWAKANPTGLLGKFLKILPFGY